jgi:flagellar hook protein FlgE
MVRSLNSGVSGLQQYQQSMDVIGNNIANVNTVGFKASRAEFSETFNQTLRTSRSGSPTMQVGSGVTTSTIKNLYTQGAVTRTGILTDLAITGEGFFVLRDTQTDLKYYTRCGEFRLDKDGYLIANNGFRVQGEMWNNSTTPPTKTSGDIKIDGSGRPTSADPAAVLSGYNIDNEGKINVKLSDGTTYVQGQILLQKFTDPQSLIKEGNNMFSAPPEAGIAAAPLAPGSEGLGKIEAEALELSNVDLTNEFTNLIKTQRAFQASARIITTSDEMIQETLNLKR